MNVAFDAELTEEGNLLLQALERLYNEYKLRIDRIYGCRSRRRKRSTMRLLTSSGRRRTN